MLEAGGAGAGTAGSVNPIGTAVPCALLLVLFPLKNFKSTVGLMIGVSLELDSISDTAGSTFAGTLPCVPDSTLVTTDVGALVEATSTFAITEFVDLGDSSSTVFAGNGGNGLFTVITSGS